MASMNVNGERVYVPEMKAELIKGLERMGTSKIGGLPLRQAHMQELQSEYRHALRLCIERRQRETREAGPARKQERRRPVQMILVPA